MEYNVLYFSRTGVSKRVAQKIADGIESKAIEITDDKNWQGVLGFIKGGFYASVGKDVNIKINGDIDKSKGFIIVSPLWAGGPAPAIRTYLKNIPYSETKLVITCDGSDVDKSIEKYENENEKFKEVYGIIKKKNNEQEVIESIISESK